MWKPAIAIEDLPQNRGCGGDGSFSEEQWMHARDALKGLRECLTKLPWVR